MLRLARYAPALIGLALIAPATARAQSHAHAHSDCDSCMAARHGSPVVKERRGVIGRLRGGDRVSIPTGHYVTQRGQEIHAHHPRHGHGAAPDLSPHHIPPSVAHHGDAHDFDAGFASIGPADAPPALARGVIGANEPLPIGEMRTSYVTPMPHAAAMAPSAMPNAAAMNGGFSGVPVIPPDPAVQAWHQNRMADRAIPRRSGPLETMLGVSEVMDFVEKRRTIRAMKASAKRGVYAPSMHEMPAWAVNPR